MRLLGIWSGWKNNWRRPESWFLKVLTRRVSTLRAKGAQEKNSHMTTDLLALGRMRSITFWSGGSLNPSKY